MAERLEHILRSKERRKARLDGARPLGNPLGNASLTEPPGLRSLTLANQTGRVKTPCVPHAWSIGEREVKGVPDRWRPYRVVG